MTVREQKRLYDLVMNPPRGSKLEAVKKYGKQFSRWNLLFLLLFYNIALAAQKPGDAQNLNNACPMPALSAAGGHDNMFTEQQEEWLGEIVDKNFKKDFHLLEDQDGYLQRIGDRLLAQLPPTSIHYHFFLVDSPQLNAFGLAGGRIYIFRRMIAFANNEDQLAGIIGHEIGHMIVHQAAVDISSWFRQLGITSVGNREDIFNRWNQLKDNAAKLKSHRETEQEQLIADRIAVYAMSRAGYDPNQFVEFADKLFETKGKTGGFWSDLFGTTSPESKRLREIIRNTAGLPANCISSRPDTSAFTRWQQSVVEAKREVATADLPGLVRKVALQPPLRAEIRDLQFSPDGRYLLAQDESSIFILTREPFAYVFRIEAPDVYPAHFTPDSTAVVFYDRELRVQKWDVKSQKQVFLRAVQAKCAESALSWSGEMLACVTHDRELHMLNVKDGSVVFSKDNLYQQTPLEMEMSRLIALVSGKGVEILLFAVKLQFSPDDRYFVAAHGDSVFGYDFSAQKPIQIPGKLKSLQTFSFIAPDQIFGLEATTPRRAVRMHFPSGQTLDQFPFSDFGQLSPIWHAPYAMIRPAGQAPIGAIDFEAKKVTLGYKTTGFAIYDKFFAGEDVDGQLKLYNLSDKNMIAQAQLPVSFLTSSKASAFSQDGKWLAVSARTRGAVWKLDNGERLVYTPDFNGALFDHEHLIAQFPKHKQEPAQIMQLDLSTLASRKLYDLESGIDSPLQQSPIERHTTNRLWQDGDLLFAVKPVDPKKPNRFALEARDVHNNNSLWQLDPERYSPRFYYLRSSNSISFVVSDYDAIKDLAKQNPALSAELEGIRGKEGKRDAYLIEVFEAKSHKPRGAVLVDTGNMSFKVRSAVSAGDNVFVNDSQNRTLIYSLSSGEQKGKVFGHTLAVSETGNRMLVENEPGVVDLYDPSTLQSLRHFTFSSRLAYATFQPGGELMVLTADQNVYEFNVAAENQKASAQ